MVNFSDHETENYQVQNQLVDQLFCLWTVCSLVAFVLVILRAGQLGVEYRDIIFVAVEIITVFAAIFRHKLSAGNKAVLLIILNISVGIAGFYSLGILSPGFVFFTIAAVVTALFFSRKTVLGFILAVMFFLSVVSAGHLLGWIMPSKDSAVIMTTPLHWTVYIFCVGCFLVVCCGTLLKYRKAMRQLVFDVKKHRDELIQSNQELQNALDEIKMLRKIFPICSFCKKVRNDKGYWEQVDVYLRDHYEANISHGICPDCMEKYYSKELRAASNFKKK